MKYHTHVSKIRMAAFKTQVHRSWKKSLCIVVCVTFSDLSAIKWQDIFIYRLQIWPAASDITMDSPMHSNSLFFIWQYAISQLWIVRSGLHLVTYLDVGNFCDKRTEKTTWNLCARFSQIFRFQKAKPICTVNLRKPPYHHRYTPTMVGKQRKRRTLDL